jgi:hypothetical protein
MRARKSVGVPYDNEAIHARDGVMRIGAVLVVALARVGFATRGAVVAMRRVLRLL